MKVLSFDLQDGHRQISYLLFPEKIKTANDCESLNVLLGGNGMTALDWSDWIVDVKQYVDGCPAFLLVEYPGYGASAGTPSPNSMHESAVKAIENAIAHFDRESIRIPRINVLGHSIGAAVASRVVASQSLQIQNLVLSAPFTSISEMIPTIFPFIPSIVASLISRHNWNNKKAVSDIIHGKNAKSITIVHGRLDEIVPFHMGETLANLGPNVQFSPIQTASHNDILSNFELYGKMLSRRND